MTLEKPTAAQTPAARKVGDYFNTTAYGLATEVKQKEEKDTLGMSLGTD